MYIVIHSLTTSEMSGSTIAIIIMLQYVYVHVHVHVGTFTWVRVIVLRPVYNIMQAAAYMYVVQRMNVSL